MSSTAAAQLTTPQCPAVPRVVRRPSHVTIKLISGTALPGTRATLLFRPSALHILTGQKHRSWARPATFWLPACPSPGFWASTQIWLLCALPADGVVCVHWTLRSVLATGSLSSRRETAQDVVHRASGLACRHAACWHAACRHARWRVVVLASRRVDGMVNGTRVVSDRSRLSRAESVNDIRSIGAQLSRCDCVRVPGCALSSLVSSRALVSSRSRGRLACRSCARCKLCIPGSGICVSVVRSQLFKNTAERSSRARRTRVPRGGAPGADPTPTTPRLRRIRGPTLG